MSIAAVAFVPSAPLLIPSVAGGSAAVDEDLRAAALDVVAGALADDPAEVVIVAAGQTPGEWSQEATWDFAGFGVARVPADSRPRLPWQLGIGGWLLDEHGWAGTRRFVGVDADGSSGTPARRAVMSVDRRYSIVVVGDGSARRSERAPGHLDPRAEPFDAEVAELLVRGDAAGIGGLDRALAAELMCGGLPAWRWTAAVLEGAAVTRADLVAHVAPYGVGYFVALWSVG